MIKDEMKTRLTKLYEKVDEVRVGNGVYEVTLVREHFDEKGRLVKSDLFRRFVTEWEPER